MTIKLLLTKLKESGLVEEDHYTICPVRRKLGKIQFNLHGNIHRRQATAIAILDAASDHSAVACPQFNKVDVEL